MQIIGGKMGTLYNVFYGQFDLVCQQLIGDVGFLTVYDIKSISILAVFQEALGLLPFPLLSPLPWMEWGATQRRL